MNLVSMCSDGGQGKNGGGRGRRKGGKTNSFREDEACAIHWQGPQDPLAQKGCDAPVERDSRHALHIRNAFRGEVGFGVEMGCISGEFAVVVILDTLDGQQLGPFEVAIRPDVGYGQGDGQRNERRRDVAVQTRKRLAEGVNGGRAVQGIGSANPDGKATCRPYHGRDDGSGSGLAFPDQGEGSGKATGA